MQGIFLKLGSIGITSIYVLLQERSKDCKKILQLQVCMTILSMFTFSTLMSQLEGEIEGGGACRQIFKRRGVLIEGSVHVGQFSIEKGC